MGILPVSRGALATFLVSLIFAVSFSRGNCKTVEVVGVGECADCAQNDIKIGRAFSGLRVTIDCKPRNGELLERRGVGELDKEGKFRVLLPEDIAEEDRPKLREECYAQLHSASATATPCPAYDGLESSGIVLRTEAKEVHAFRLAGKLKFSPVTCASAFFWPHLKYLQPLPLKNLRHPFPFPFPSLPKKALPPPVPKSLRPAPPGALPSPVPKKPLPPPVPKSFWPAPPEALPPRVPKKPLPPPVPKSLRPPPIPIYKPKPPEPLLSEKPSPILKVLPPPIPIYKPKAPVPKALPPLAPIHKPKPHFIKPLPPFPKIPPFYKKPNPPLPRLPPIPNVPPKHFHHPKFRKLPPLTPFPSRPVLLSQYHYFKV